MNPYLMIFEREMSPIRKLLLLHLAAGGKLTEYTVTGNPVSFETNVAKPLTECLLSFSPVQSGTGDPSPENIRPITGITGANVYLSDTGTDDPDKQTFSVTFPQEVGTAYGGTLDLTTGVLTVDWVSKNLGDFTWTKVPASASSANTYFYFVENNGTANGKAGIAATDVFSSALEVIARNSIYQIAGTEGIACESFQNTKIAVYASVDDTASLTAAQFADAVDGYYLAYKLRTPVIYQLTPTEIKTLIGN